MNPKTEKSRWFGDYELLEEIDHDWWGTVYKARQVSLDRLVALTIVGGRLGGEAEAKCFHREAGVVARLDHPNIPVVYDVGEHEGKHYLCSRLVEGRSLMVRVREDAELMPLVDGVRMLIKVARAVHYAHQWGIVHGDINPGNILIDGNDEPYLTHFWLARTKIAIDAEKGMPWKTSADIHGLGVLLYVALTGEMPYNIHRPLETLLQTKFNESQRASRLNREVDPDLDGICLKCLEIDPQRRYQLADGLSSGYTTSWCWAMGPLRDRDLDRDTGSNAIAPSVFRARLLDSHRRNAANALWNTAYGFGSNDCR